MSLLRAAPAKVNLFLDVLGKREDGFHELHTLFAGITLSDIVSFERAPGNFAAREEPCLEVSGDEAGDVPSGDDNLVLRALNLFAEELSRKNGVALPAFWIRLKKNVPHGAGLGGGSSDAAAALTAVNSMTKPSFSKKELHALAAQIGSDCAFFMDGGTAEGTGRGEILTPWPSRKLHLLIALPPVAINTTRAYRKLRPEDMGAKSDVAALRRWLVDERAAPPHLENAFEAALDADYPALRETREKLMEQGAQIARLTGSGAASFGVFPDTESSRRASETLSRDYRCWVCETIP